MAILPGLGFRCHEELCLERELGLAFDEETPRGSWPAWVSISVFAGGVRLLGNRVHNGD